MSSFTLSAASERLAELIGVAERGEQVLITRDGHPVAELRAWREIRLTREEANALARANRERNGPMSEESVTSVRRIREGQDW